MAQQFFNLAEVMGQVDLSRAREQQMRDNDMQMKRQQRQDADLEAQNGAFRDSFETVDGKTSFNNEKAIELMAKTNPEMAYKLQQQMQENQLNSGKLQNENRSSELKYQIDLSQYAGNAMASATPQTWGIIKQDLISRGVKAAEGMPDTFDPDFQGKFLMDAKSFLKQSGGGDEDNLVIPTPDGLMYFNKKNKKDFGYIEQGGKRVMRSQDDAPLRGQVKEAEARATAGYKINDSVDGVVSTDRQVAETANPQLIRPAQGSQFGTPSMRVQPNVQQQRDATRLQVLMGEREPNVYNAELEKEIARMGGDRQPKMAGIIVPTKAQQAASEATAKDTVAVQSDKNKAVRKSDQLLANVSQAEQLLKLDPTGSGIGAAMDVAGRMVGLSSSSAKVATQLETLSGWMVANVPRMEGPQSNFDVQNYQTMAAKIGDRTTPVSERKAALKTMKELQLKYKALNSNESNSSPLTLTLPNGKTATFKDKAMMDAYKKYKGIK